MIVAGTIAHLHVRPVSSFLEYQVASFSNRNQKEVILSRHGLFRCSGSCLPLILSCQLSRDQFKLDHGQVFTQARSRPLGEGHEQLSHFGGDVFGLHPSLGPEDIRLWEGGWVALCRVTLH